MPFTKIVTRNDSERYQCRPPRHWPWSKWRAGSHWVCPDCNKDFNYIQDTYGFEYWTAHYEPILRPGEYYVDIIKPSDRF